MLLMLIFAVSCKKESKTTASFTTAKSNYYLTEPVTFVNNSVNVNNYLWDFGDGQTSTDQSPQHNYTAAGNYQTKLTTNGNAVFTKSIKVYNGTASYEVDNSTSAALPLVSFASDANNNVINFVDHGTIASNGKTDSVFTNNASIYAGGNIGTKTFIVVAPYPIVKFTHNKLAILNTTQIYVGAGINKPTTESVLKEKSTPRSIQNLMQ